MIPVSGVSFGIGSGDDDEMEVTEILSKMGDATSLLSLSGGGVFGVLAPNGWCATTSSNRDIMDKMSRSRCLGIAQAMMKALSGVTKACVD